MNRLLRAWRALVRDYSGEGRYQRYLAHQRQHHPERPALTRREFFREEQQRKWQGVTRCC